MGGFGSGRRSDRGSTDGAKRLDVRNLKRQGLLEPGSIRQWVWSTGGEVTFAVNVTTEADNSVLLAYRRRLGGEWATVVSRVMLDRTNCTFGGSRVWWRCPARGCGRRCAVLYRPAGGMFACRQCHELAFGSTRETPSDRAYRRAGRLRKRLGWPPGIVYGMGPKPPRMHWQTYLKMIQAHNELVGRAVSGSAAWLSRIEARSREVRRRF